jgi:hypothetical protein
VKEDVNQFGKGVFTMESKEENLKKYVTTLDLEFYKMCSKTRKQPGNIVLNLKKYSKEIGLDYILSVEELIESHRNLRNSHIKNLAEFRAGSEEYRKRGYEEGYVNAINREFISFEDLKKMNVKEFADHLCNY